MDKNAKFKLIYFAALLLLPVVVFFYYHSVLWTHLGQSFFYLQLITIAANFLVAMALFNAMRDKRFIFILPIGYSILLVTTLANGNGTPATTLILAASIPCSLFFAVGLTVYEKSIKNRFES